MKRKQIYTTDITYDQRLGINFWNAHTVTGLNLMNNYDISISEICIINGPNLKNITKELSHLEKFKTKTFTSFNMFNNMLDIDQSVRENTEISKIACPTEYKDLSWINHIKLMNHNMDYAQVTRILDHMVIWHYCIVTGNPVILLETDATPFILVDTHFPRNSIISLSKNSEFYHLNDNWVCMQDVKSYVIDSFSAKTLFNNIMDNGITDPIELIFRIDKYNIVPVEKLLDKVQ